MTEAELRLQQVRQQLQQSEAQARINAAANEAVLRESMQQLVEAKTEAIFQRRLRELTPLGRPLEPVYATPSSPPPLRPVGAGRPQWQAAAAVKAPPVGRTFATAQPHDFPTVPNARAPVMSTPAAEQMLAQTEPTPTGANPERGQYFSGEMAAGTFANFNRSTPSYEHDRGLAPEMTAELMSRRQKLVTAAGRSATHNPHGFAAPRNESPYSQAALAKLAANREARKRAAGQ